MAEHTVTDAEVAAYLAEHPDFFEQHPDLLADMQLPHDSGNAISLVERQVAVLRERNMDMRHRLSKLLDNARDNDKLFDKTKRLVLAVLEGRKAEDTVNTLYYSFEKDFQIHFTRLVLFRPIPGKLGQARCVTLTDAKTPLAKFLKSQKAMCGQLGNEEKAYIFGEQAPLVGSAAVVPLIHGTCFGLLAVGNRDANYYRSSMGTLFLGYIAEILNRTLPYQLER
ncbi:DUF484 family protein [Simiduia sp. 21SJ11W-1]|uniref:DUF484 family protein n=1 Tax=Simiduia sp. 21SJ11W-1 TaxID=2909669 RepID=UPI0020A1763A|nr:DUF484 family protein [Simiduia sp. 21SJ11W-1]UTA47788.1 DUF484 family protein [Simiduia sp. 21SJ11W-1]